MDYSNIIEAIKDKYEDRAVAIMQKIADLLNQEGMAVDGPYPFDGLYSWVVTVDPNNSEQHSDFIDGVDLTLEITEERYYDDESGYGINFGIKISTQGGRLLGGLTPFNYTELCWVDARNAEEVEKRFRCIEAADIHTIPNVVRS